MPPPTDKYTTGLAAIYTELFRGWRERPVRVLEIGIFEGGSMWFWRELFPHPESVIVGVDQQLPQVAFPGNVKLFACDQNDSAGLKEIARVHGPFDLIVDDGSHFAAETRSCFATLFGAVKVGGCYLIEDWAVGYFKDQDPRYRGMVEVVTDIVRDVPGKSIDSFQVSLNPGQAFAVFRKGAQGWNG
jgi:hypothetical protein